MTTPELPAPQTERAVRPDDTPSRSSGFWTRHKTLINFWLDLLLLILFLVQGWMLAIVALVFPRGDTQWLIWGAAAADWLDGLWITFCLFAVGVVIHVMLHWSWICGAVATRLLSRKAVKDDGSQTLIGVGLLIALLHIFAAAVLAARVSLIRSP